MNNLEAGAIQPVMNRREATVQLRDRELIDNRVHDLGCCMTAAA
ncbi:hypothetical protein [Defluviicoccus vanus]|nr:hypothetical protein [Defluviicoccus vanus]